MIHLLPDVLSETAVITTMVLMLMMLLGRLELFSMIMLFSRSFWKN